MANSPTINPRYLTYNKDEVQEILDNVKEVDTAPTAGSQYPVSSDGVKTALEGIEAATLQFDENADPLSLLD